MLPFALFRTAIGGMALVGLGVVMTGTVLLICWLLAYALEPDGWYARIGLMLALGAYGIDLVREKWAGWREDRKAQTVSTGTARAVKAA